MEPYFSRKKKLDKKKSIKMTPKTARKGKSCQQKLILKPNLI